MRAYQLLVVGLLAMTSSATAQPEEDGERVPYFQRDGGRYRPSRSERDWVRLASPTSTRFGTEYIVISQDMGMFRSLRVEAVAGIVKVRRISVVTHNSVWKAFYPNRRLDKNHPTLHVDLGSSTQISLIVITTDRRLAGSYTIYGSSGRTAPVLVASQ